MIKLFLIAATALASATPAVAKDAKPAETVQPDTGATPTARPAQSAKDTVKYCVMETSTGSRIAHKTCHTRAEWLRDGFDPLEQ